MDTDKDKNVSCFALDGVVAEMVIEVEENQKTGFDDLAPSPSKNSNPSQECIDSENKVDEGETAPVEIIDSEKKEEEKIVETLETFQENKDDKDENKVLSVKKFRKRKFKAKLNHVDNTKISEGPRYPGRKRQANKRYISDDLITSKADKSESSLSKETHKGEKRRKLDKDPKDEKHDKVTQKKQDLDNIKESHPIVDTETTIKEKRSIHSTQNDTKIKEELEILEDEVPKQKTLRKLPFRKNKDAPDIPDFTPKVVWWNGVGDGIGARLGDLPEIKKRIKGAKSVRALYRVLYYQWPTNGQDLIGQILDFNGFPFDKTSYEFTKRQSLMKIMLDVTVANVCDILGVKKGPKSAMINNILNFLLRPYGRIDPALDPSLQPVVLLERIVLDDKFFLNSSESVKIKKFGGNTKIKNAVLKNKEKSLEFTPVRATRNSLSKRKSVEIAVSKKGAVKEKEDSKGSLVRSKLSVSKDANLSAAKSTSKEKTTSPVKSNKLSSKDKEDKVKQEEKAKSGGGAQKSGNENDAPNEIKVKRGRKFKKVGKPKTLYKTILKKPSENISKKDIVTADMDIDNEPDNYITEDTVTKDNEPSDSTIAEKSKESGKESKLDFKSTNTSSVVLSDSSETESAEETRLVTASSSNSKSTPKSPQMRRGKPLKMFPNVSDSIKNSPFSALQRLHILLFGASDKPEFLKSNILAFGGFPFLEGSDEWKQKHFLLSLLAQSNLREYLKLLCIEFSDDDQPTMINKLMRFLACPSEKALTKKSHENKKVSASLEIKKKEGEILPKKDKSDIKKKNVKKKDEKKTGGNRRRKVLMSEEEARRLEASFAREQRAIARESKAPPPIVKSTEHYATIHPPIAPKPPITDPQQLNALLQTVYKRRALKAAGAIISLPNKGEKIKLGDIENIKFLIVTSNLRDLEVLHQLIYMMSASKSRLRKNILDFDGFSFNEDSEKYKERMDFLNNLGYEVSKRLSFLLGLCTLQTEIPQQDLNELIMYFLMSPCKSKQVVPITQMPVKPSKGLPEQNLISSPIHDTSKSSIVQPIPKSSPKSKVQEVRFKASTPVPPNMRQKARKSFSSSLKMSPVKKVLLPPSASTAMNRILNFSQNQSMANSPKSVAVLNSVQPLPTYPLLKTSVPNSGPNIALLNNPGNVAALNPSKPSNMNTLIKVPVGNTGTLNHASKVALLDAAAKIPSTSNVAGQIMQNPVIFSNVGSKMSIPSQQHVNIQGPILQGSKVLVRPPSGVASPQEFLVQQQTPDGQQKTFKLIRLPPNHPLASAVKPPVQQTIPTPQVQQPLIITGAPVRGGVLPPGIIVMKNNPALQFPAPNVQNVLQTIPLKVNMPVNKSSNPVVNISHSNTDEFVLPDEGESAGASENDPDVEILNPLEEGPPSDDDLYSSIQEIILSSNFENITLRNVIERVSAQFPHHDLTHRHNFMKECVKKIIIGT